MNVSRYFVTAAACLLVLSGCGAGPSGSTTTSTPISKQSPSSGEKPPSSGPILGPGEFTDARGLPFPVPSTQANPILLVDRKTAWGDKLTITEIPASIDADHALVLKAVSEDGGTIAGLVVPRSLSSESEYKLVLMDVATKQITEVERIRSSLKEPWMMTEVALDGQWLLWRVNSVMQVYNISTQAHSQIKPSNTRWVETYVPPQRAIAVDDGVVVWTEAAEEDSEPGRIATVVKSADLATGEVSIIGKHGAYPATSGSTVAWIEPNLAAQDDDLVPSKVVVRDLKVEGKQALEGFGRLTMIAIHGDAVAYTGWLRFGGKAELVNLSQTRKQVIGPDQNADPDRITLNDRLVAMTSYIGGVQVWDRKLGHLVNLGGHSDHTGAGMINGNALAWQSATDYQSWTEYQSSKTLPKNMSIFVMDTSQLP